MVVLSILPQQSGFPLSDMLRSPESPVGNQSARGLFEEFLREARIGAESAAAVPRGNREAAGEETGADPETPAEAAALAPGLLIPAASAPSTGAAVSPDSGAADAGGGDDRVKVDREEAVFLSGVSPGRDEKPVSTGERLRKSAPEVDRAGGEGPGAADKDGAEGIAASSGAAETGADGSRVFRENRSSPGLADGRTPGSVAGKADGKVAG
ncbi:MAG: hypothetical protein LBL56_05135, partial [Treponema sp.]|nr:hypothetical protein [Treponema sp.]